MNAKLPALSSSSWILRVLVKMIAKSSRKAINKCITKQRPTQNHHKQNEVHKTVFTFSKQAFNESLDFLQPFIATRMTKNSLTAAKLTCPCNTHRTEVTLTSVVIDSEPHLSRTCKTSLLFAPLAVRVYTGCSAFPFYTLRDSLKTVNTITYLENT